ncbi:MAG: hypothetical protein J6N32_08925 [Clostridia bacterium]|nr:hypothetical protein [Clostridia bacterium]MBO5258214.1 hypothetical protein [Clostridia bacterium]MBP3293861.1 hypothetical protein [Clostridia bacterium]
MKTIEDLYYGNKIPSETHIVRRKQWKRLFRQSAVLERELWHTMTREQKKQYEACCEKCTEAHDLELLDSFTKGFCLGMRLTLEGVFSFKK